MIESLASALNVVSSNSYFGPLPKIKISFFLLSGCTEELLSIPNIITFLPNPQLCENEKVPRAWNHKARWNPILYPEYF